MYRRINDRPGEGNALRKLGVAYYSLGNYDKLIEHQLHSLAITREIKNRSGEGESLDNLGFALFRAGNSFDSPFSCQFTDIMPRLTIYSGFRYHKFTFLNFA